MCNQMRAHARSRICDMAIIVYPLLDYLIRTHSGADSASIVVYKLRKGSTKQ